MYGGGFVPEEANQAKQLVADDPIKLEEFEARIARGEKIEAHDWMPFEYRKQLIRMIEQHAHSEIMGALPEGTWITRAPGFRRKMILIAKVQDEIGHGQLLYAAAETLGKSREAMTNDLLSGKSKYSNVFNYPAKTWADIAVIGFLIDAAAIVNQVANSKGSYGPYCRALERICYEESFHLKQGHDAFIALATGTLAQKEMLQDALNRWYIPILHFFGPPDKASVHGDSYVPKILELGMTLPDPNLKKNSDGVWEFSDPDWELFKRVINGDGPCNKERIEVRKYAEETHRWVRKALMGKGEKAMIPYA
jgi:ring-1,2-phenylacetyl-CoA epoxidase subunit PaaA